MAVPYRTIGAWSIVCCLRASQRLSGIRVATTLFLQVEKLHPCSDEQEGRFEGRFVKFAESSRDFSRLDIKRD
jgi:hypothetical protein